MSTTIDQKAYLQKYLGGSLGEKKKKKKKIAKGKGFKIIDDDIDLTKLRPLEGDELDILGEGEDAPQIAGIIDERPEEIRKLEQFKTSSKWRVINQDDGFNSKIQIEEVKRDIKEVEKENEIIFGKMYSDSEDETKKDDSDASPPRKQSKNESKTKGKARAGSDSDISPPRKRDISPKSSKQRRRDSDASPPRRNRESSPKRTQQKDYDSDLSPPRKGRQDTSKKSKERARKSRWGDREETKSSRRSRSNSSKRKSDKRPNSPQRSRRKSPDISPPRKSQKQNYDSDLSPPRKSRKDEQSRNNSKRNKSPYSDISPPRKRKSSPRNNRKPERSRNDSDSDLSPPRKRSSKHSPQRNTKRAQESDSDLSPPRKEKARRVRNSDSPPPSNKKMAKTLEGKMAGLQNAAQLREENEEFRRKQDEAFKKMGDEVSGRNAQVVSRRSKRENSEEKRKQQEKAERQKELDEKYKKWSKGLKQLEDQQARAQDFIHEASKPLARHRDDRDLENRLKDVEREGDPMLQYIRERKRDRGELAPERPTYKGNFPPNRFNIRPGYRWDGVDRSNGYEKKYFDQQSKRRAQEEEAYKWSTEDL